MASQVLRLKVCATAAYLDIKSQKLQNKSQETMFLHFYHCWLSPDPTGFWGKVLLCSPAQPRIHNPLALELILELAGYKYVPPCSIMQNFQTLFFSSLSLSLSLSVCLKQNAICHPHSLNYPWAHYVAKDSLEFLILLKIPHSMSGFWSLSMVLWSTAVRTQKF